MGQARADRGLRPKPWMPEPALFFFIGGEGNRTLLRNCVFPGFFPSQVIVLSFLVLEGSSAPWIHFKGIHNHQVLEKDISEL